MRIKNTFKMIKISCENFPLKKNLSQVFSNGNDPSSKRGPFGMSYAGVAQW